MIKQFIIKRTSDWAGKKQPIKEAKKVEFLKWDVRGCDEDFFNKNLADNDGGIWRSKGKEHTVIGKKHIARAFDDFAWEVEIKNLEDLLKITEENGDVIISKHYHSHLYKTKDVYEIEIYDDYKE